MRRFLGFAAGAVALALAATPVFGSSIDPLADYEGWLRETAGGTLPETFTRTTYEVDALGNVIEVTRTLPIELHVEAIRALARPGHARPAAAVGGDDAGYGSETGVLGPDNWRECYSVMGYVIQFGPPNKPPPSLATATVPPVAVAGALGTGNVCNLARAGYATLTYPDLTFDVRKHKAQWIETYVFANHWLSDDRGGRYADPAPVLSFHGEGVYWYDGVCFFGLCISADVFYGDGALVVLGNEATPPLRK